MYTFFPIRSLPWKWGGSTLFATSSKPFSVAFPIRVMGVSLLTQRPCLPPDENALVQMRCTNPTGSTGALVLKNRTSQWRPISSAHLDGLHLECWSANLTVQLGRALTTFDVNSDWTEKFPVLGLSNIRYFPLNLGFNVPTPWFIFMIAVELFCLLFSIRQPRSSDELIANFLL
jgi:hypothetical protein